MSRSYLLKCFHRLCNALRYNSEKVTQLEIQLLAHISWISAKSPMTATKVSKILNVYTATGSLNDVSNLLIKTENVENKLLTKYEEK